MNTTPATMPTHARTAVRRRRWSDAGDDAITGHSPPEAGTVWEEVSEDSATL